MSMLLINWTKWHDYFITMTSSCYSLEEDDVLNFLAHKKYHRYTGMVVQSQVGSGYSMITRSTFST
jgi:hypothetical protein